MTKSIILDYIQFHRMLRRFHIFLFLLFQPSGIGRGFFYEVLDLALTFEIDPHKSTLLRIVFAI